MQNFSTWTHANGAMLATVDTETTGLRAGYHDVIQVAVLPLNADLKPSGIEPFNLIFKPDNPKHIAKRAMEVNKITMKQIYDSPSPETAWFIFEDWYEKNVKANGYKKILPIGQNLKFDEGFIKEWAEWDDEARDWRREKNHDINCSDEYFDWRNGRDTQIVAKYINDLAYERNDPFPFQKLNLGYLATQFNIDKSDAHDALADCVMTAKLYRRLLALQLKKPLDFGAVSEDF